MPRPRKEIAQQIRQQAESIQGEAGIDAGAVARDIAAEAEELAVSTDALTLLNQLYEFCITVPAHCELDRGAWVQQRLLALIDQIKAAL
jgi:hypothetical protein